MELGITGRIHSIETFGAVDGPGIRYIVFLQGCPLRCLYCHNPDSWAIDGGEIADSEKVVDDIISFKNFIKSGGVTISGGEPLVQTDFLVDLLKRLKQEGIHTAIDTSGAVPLEKAKPAIDLADMLLLDIKSFDTIVCEALTGKTNESALEILKYCEETNKKVWIRHVLVPEYTLKKHLLEQMASYLKDFKCIEKVELLPFHKMGEFKWQELGKQYELYKIEKPSKSEIAMAKDIFINQGFNM